MNFQVTDKSLVRIRNMKEQYVALFPGSPLSNYTTDQDILLFMIFYAESKMIERIEKKRIFGGAAIPDPD
jgi:hypothetical protein